MCVFCRPGLILERINYYTVKVTANTRKGECMKQGFTLIELLVVVLIIGILSAIALPQYEIAVEKSRAAEGLTMARSIAQANQAYYMANGDWAADLNDLDLSFPGEDKMVGASRSRITKNFSCRARGSDGGTAYLAVCRRVGPKYTYAIVYRRDNPSQAICLPDTGDEQANLKMCKALTNKTAAPYTFN